jgi:hypothetical protein
VGHDRLVTPERTGDRLTAVRLEYHPAAGVLEKTRPLLARGNAMRLLHIRRTIALATAVAATALAAGPAVAHTPIDGPSRYGEWTADVERPAEQYRGRYQLKLDEARNLLAEAPPAERGIDV